jgi:hypothetical protein
MKMTKRQLRSIIKEEKARILNEGNLEAQQRLLELVSQVPDRVLASEITQELNRYFDAERGL